MRFVGRSTSEGGFTMPQDSVQEFEEWWKGDKAGSALERAATLAAKYAWRESARRQESELDSLKAKMAILAAEVDAARKDIEEARRVQMEKDCAVVRNHLEHCRIHQSDDNEGDCVCEAESHMNAIRMAF